MGDEIQQDDPELGPFTEARRVSGDSVMVRKQNGNLVQKLYFDAQDLAALREVLQDDA